MTCKCFRVKRNSTIATTYFFNWKLYMEYTSEVLQKRILVRGDGYLVFDKFAGFETVVLGGGNSRQCLTSLLRRKFDLPEIYPVHRLDRDTTGCLLFATDKEALTVLEKNFKDRAVKKLYLGLCGGVPSSKEGEVKKPLTKWDGGRSPVRVARGKGGGLPARTDYRVVCSTDGKVDGQKRASLLRFQLHTGRTHQIRVHASSIGHAILGDDQYGDRKVNRQIKKACGLNRQALHAWKLVFQNPFDEKKVTACSFLPDDISAALDATIPGWIDSVKKLK
jgi:23S rRNA pseudouridine955/2504/2580 synthase